jgi:hypothetical protein
MGGPGQLFSYKELKSRSARTGAKLKADAIADITDAAAADISRVIIVIRKSKTAGGRKRKKRRKYR